MMKNNILKIFYEDIIPEAATGRVDCYFIYNMIFNTRVPEKKLEVISKNSNSSLMIPTLYITNVEKFEELLVQYVEKALEFYEDENFCEEVLQGFSLGNGKVVSKEKVIMTLLWSNATVEDFQNPCEYLRKRIQFFDLGDLSVFSSPQIVGYSELLDSNIECNINKSRIESETPYFLQTFLLNSNSNERIYEFPRVYFGISDDIANIFAIQNGKDRLIDSKDRKRIERKMYKVNEGLDVHEDTYDNYGLGNLKDVTPSFLVVANIASGLFKSYGIRKLNIPSILISRWNAKMLMIDFKQNFYKKKGYNDEEITRLVDDIYSKTKMLQTNLTDKFLRTFRRLGYHHSSVGIVGYPMEIDSNLSLFMYDQSDICNNSLLDETFCINQNNNLKK